MLAFEPALLQQRPDLRVVEPLGYLDLLNLMANARLVLTDLVQRFLAASRRSWGCRVALTLQRVIIFAGCADIGASPAVKCWTCNGQRIRCDLWHLFMDGTCSTWRNARRRDSCSARLEKHNRRVFVGV